MLRVFISHKKEDSGTATEIAAYLKLNGMDVYLDTIDSQLALSGPDLADYIREQLEKSTQLLAVISPVTQASWWVPWEIGVATEKERFLASFVANNAAVPEYLAKWPYLRSRSDLDVYIRESKKAQMVVEERTRSGYRTTAQATGFRSFHTNLRAALRQ
ncbi:MAG: toll/interleukin-1 receptor domain-containing protein [Bosea sp.]|uniref:toll/interleukin-1 receptor domain-containing protein n=1 Tax=Bosea sp. (in: a-proteobacteria) TaxID=1871050 RepID=UPI001ACFF339|nr:toll/interleukin-1 receptor domain-containing protein [Bosea sp. (in: a-proteobacteria)]MBN9471793.1 toll/interleukin-1 receptor domain-containing protein [Bosea sp. (in: a-proteobacteria)]